MGISGRSATAGGVALELAPNACTITCLLAPPYLCGGAAPAGVPNGGTYSVYNRQALIVRQFSSFIHQIVWSKLCSANVFLFVCISFVVAGLDGACREEGDGSPKCHTRPCRRSLSLHMRPIGATTPLAHYKKNRERFVVLRACSSPATFLSNSSDVSEVPTAHQS